MYVLTNMYSFTQVDMLVSRLSEKLVYHIMKFIGAEIEATRHLGFYAQWSHCVMMHHSLWIKRKWKELLPVLNQMQKALNQKVTDLSEICDRNKLTMDFLFTMASMKKSRAVIKSSVVDAMEEEDEDDDDATGLDHEDLPVNMHGLQSKWSDDEE